MKMLFIVVCQADGRNGMVVLVVKQYSKCGHQFCKRQAEPSRGCGQGHSVAQQGTGATGGLDGFSYVRGLALGGHMQDLQAYLQ